MPVIARTPFHASSLRIISRILFILLALLILASVLYTLALNTLFRLRPPFQCSRTLIYPFDTGCPYNCSAVRNNNQRGPFYRTNLMWIFGELAGFQDGSKLPDSAFHAQTDFAETFINLEDTLRENVKQEVNAESLAPLHEYPQRRIHVSLSYLCCLTEGESEKVKSIVSAWNTTRSFDMTLRFDRLECYHEQDNSVAVTFEVGERSERELMQMNRELRDRLEEKGVRVWVERVRQMRFHTTLMGLQTTDGGSIAGYLGAIWRSVREADGEKAKARIQFKPVLGEFKLSKGS